MPRRDSQDADSEVTINFSKDPSTKSISDEKLAQLARAREVALTNRRRKMKAKLEARLADIRSKLPDLKQSATRVCGRKADGDRRQTSVTSKSTHGGIQGHATAAL